MTLLCYSASGTADNVTRVKNYGEQGNPATLNACSALIAADPLYTKPDFAFGGNRAHYGTNLETTNQTSGSVMTDDFNHDRLPMLSCKASNTYAALGAALPGSSIYTNLQNRGVEIKNWQDAHRGQGKWGASFVWMLDHELNGSGAQPAASWLAAMHNIIEIWKSVGVVLWDGENDFTTYTEGLMPGLCLLGGKSANHDDMYAYWPDDDDWANQNLVLYAPDIYNGSANTRYWPPSTLFDPMRTRMQAKAASQALLHNDNHNRQGRPYLQVLYEHACAELPHFTQGAGTGAGSWASVFGTTPYTKAFWQTQAAAYLEDQWPDLSALVYWDSNAQANTGQDAVGASNYLDSSQGAWDAFVSTWASGSNFQNATDPLPTGTAPAPDVDSPTVLQSTAIINSGVSGTVFNSAPFSVGPDELILLWTEAERTDGVYPGIPALSFPSAPVAGANPAFTRIPGADHQWSPNAQQGLWVASTETSGPASGVGLRVTWPAAVGGCTVVMERVVGADLAGAVAAAIVGSPVKATATSALGVTALLPNPANVRDRSFVLSCHRMNEPTTPGVSGAKTATLIGSGGSMTPLVGRLHLALVYMADGGGVAPVVNSLTGNNLTWTKIAEQVDTAIQGTVSLWQGVGAAPTTGTPTITTNLGGGLSLLRSHFIDISNASGIGNVQTGIITAGQGAFGYVAAMAYQQTTSGLLTMALLGQNAAAGLTPLQTTAISGTGGAQGVTDEISRFEVWRATFDDSRPANPGYSWSEPHYFFAGLFVEIVGGPSAVLAEGTDVVRSTPGPIGVETAHSVGVFQANIAASWATPAAAGLVAIEVATGPPAVGERLGATSQHITTFETMLGRSVDSQRVYVTDTAALVNWGSGGWATAVAAEAAGRAVFVSCFLGANTWVQVAAGNANAFLDTLGANLAAFGQPGVFCYFPQPEDDTGTRGTSAQFRAASSFVIDRLRPLMPGWRFANVLQDATWFGTSAFVGTPYFVANGRIPTDWIVPQADVLGVDAFNTRGAVVGSHPYANPAAATYPDMPISLFADPFIATAVAQAKYLMLSEFGCAVDDPALNPNGHATRAAWIGSAMAYMKGRVEAVHYADLDSADGRINMRITGGVKAAEQDSVDAFKTGASANHITKSHTTTAIVRKTTSKTQTATAIVRKTLTQTQTATAVVRRPFTIAHTADGIISKGSVTRSHTSDAYIAPYVLVNLITTASASDVSTVTVS